MGNVIHRLIPAYPAEAEVTDFKGGRQNGARIVRGSAERYPVVMFADSHAPESQNAKYILKCAGLREVKGQAGYEQIAASAYESMKKSRRYFVVYNLDQRDDEHQLKAGLRDVVGNSTLPQVFVSGELIGGAEALRDARASGKLASLVAQMKRGPNDPPAEDDCDPAAVKRDAEASAAATAASGNRDANGEGEDYAGIAVLAESS